MRGWICVPTISRTKPKITWLQILIHILGWLPLAWILFDYFTGRLSVNPIQDIEQRLGRIAVYFLIASLACTPLYTLTGWREPLKRRRALGLYCFMYASLHVLTFIGLDYGFNLSLIGGIVLQKPYAIVGLATFHPSAPTGGHFLPLVDEETGSQLDQPASPGLPGRQCSTSSIMPGRKKAICSP